MHPAHLSWNSSPSEIDESRTTSEKRDCTPPPYSALHPTCSGLQINANIPPPPCLTQSSGINMVPLYTQGPPPYSKYPPMFHFGPVLGSNLPSTSILNLPSNGSNRATEQPYCIDTRSFICEDYMGYSILGLFLFLPLGIFAVFHSIKTRLANKKGNMEAAVEHSRKSLFFNKISRFGLLFHFTWIFIVVWQCILEN